MALTTEQQQTLLSAMHTEATILNDLLADWYNPVSSTAPTEKRQAFESIAVSGGTLTALQEYYEEKALMPSEKLVAADTSASSLLIEIKNGLVLQATNLLDFSGDDLVEYIDGVSNVLTEAEALLKDNFTPPVSLLDDNAFAMDAVSWGEEDLEGPFDELPGLVELDPLVAPAPIPEMPPSFRDDDSYIDIQVPGDEHTPTTTTIHTQHPSPAIGVTDADPLHPITPVNVETTEQTSSFHLAGLQPVPASPTLTLLDEIEGELDPDDQMAQHKRTVIKALRENPGDLAGQSKSVVQTVIGAKAIREMQADRDAQSNSATSINRNGDTVIDNPVEHKAGEPEVRTANREKSLAGRFTNRFLAFTGAVKAALLSSTETPAAAAANRLRADTTNWAALKKEQAKGMEPVPESPVATASHQAAASSASTVSATTAEEHSSQQPPAWMLNAPLNIDLAAAGEFFQKVWQKATQPIGDNRGIDASTPNNYAGQARATVQHADTWLDRNFQNKVVTPNRDTAAHVWQDHKVTAIAIGAVGGIWGTMALAGVGQNWGVGSKPVTPTNTAPTAEEVQPATQKAAADPSRQPFTSTAPAPSTGTPQADTQANGEKRLAANTPKTAAAANTSARPAPAQTLRSAQPSTRPQSTQSTHTGIDDSNKTLWNETKEALGAYADRNGYDRNFLTATVLDSFQAEADIFNDGTDLEVHGDGVKVDIITDTVDGITGVLTHVSPDGQQKNLYISVDEEQLQQAAQAQQLSTLMGADWNPGRG